MRKSNYLRKLEKIMELLWYNVCYLNEGANLLITIIYFSRKCTNWVGFDGGKWEPILVEEPCLKWKKNRRFRLCTSRTYVCVYLFGHMSILISFAPSSNTIKLAHRRPEWERLENQSKHILSVHCHRVYVLQNKSKWEGVGAFSTLFTRVSGMSAKRRDNFVACISKEIPSDNKMPSFVKSNRKCVRIHYKCIIEMLFNSLFNIFCMPWADVRCSGGICAIYIHIHWNMEST